MPGLTKDGRRLVVLRGKDKNATSPLAEDAMKLLLMIGDLRLALEETGVAGDIYILDAGIVTPTHFAKVTPGLVKKFLVCVEVKTPTDVIHLFYSIKFS